MKFIDCSRFYLLLVPLQCLTMTIANISGFASCTSSSFSRSIGYILRGFLLGEFEVGDVMECKKRCIISANCLSLNILMNSNGRSVCQLNSGRKEDGVREQFVQHGAGEYYGLKEKRMCSHDGGTCSNETPWHAFNQSYFQYVRIEHTHFDAQKYCEEQNGDLASISSEEEQTFLFKTFFFPDVTGIECYIKTTAGSCCVFPFVYTGKTYQSCTAAGYNVLWCATTSNYDTDGLWGNCATSSGDAVHIGMNDIAEEGVYVWDDGSPVTHTRFTPGDPNNYQNQDCMGLMRIDGGFGDIQCYWQKFFICESDYSKLSSWTLNN